MRKITQIYHTVLHFTLHNRNNSPYEFPETFSFSPSFPAFIAHSASSPLRRSPSIPPIFFASYIFSALVNTAIKKSDQHPLEWPRHKGDSSVCLSSEVPGCQTVSSRGKCRKRVWETLLNYRCGWLKVDAILRILQEGAVRGDCGPAEGG